MTVSGSRQWECVACGYVHTGAEPPDTCPVCGASRSEFKLYQPPVPAVAVSVRSWRCMDCGYVHTGPEPPAECPVCGAPADRFESIINSADAFGGDEAPRRIVVVGAGIAGLAAVESIRSASRAAEITLISKESQLPYQRLNLTRYLAGEVTEDNLPIRPAAWYEERNVRLLVGRKAERIDTDDRSVILDDRRRIPFDRLILATGASAAVPPIARVPADNVLRLRTLNDARAILRLAQAGARCICIGGGILGLEAAGALARRGVEVDLIENHGWLLPRQLNEKAARILEGHVTKLGIRLHHRAAVAEIGADGRARRVGLQDGSGLSGDLVLLATGIRPDTELATQCGLAVNRGVLVNDHLETANPHILAAGDGAEHRGVVYGLWVASQIQGNLAGLNAIGRKVAFGGIPRSNFLKVLGIDLFSVGLIEAEGAAGRVIEQESDGRYLRFVFRDGRLAGAILLGDTGSAPMVRKAVEERADLSNVLNADSRAEHVLATLAS